MIGTVKEVAFWSVSRFCPVVTNYPTVTNAVELPCWEVWGSWVQVPLGDGLGTLYVNLFETAVER